MEGVTGRMEYLLGFATLPAVLTIGAALYFGGKAFAGLTVRALRRIPLGKPGSRAAFAAAAASARRVHMVGFGGVAFVLALGYRSDREQFGRVQRAVLDVLRSEPAPVSPRQPG